MGQRQPQPPYDAEILRGHGLTPAEYARVEALLGRAPTWPELGVFSVMWSEHCAYKSSRVHLKRLPTTGPQVVQGPGENAGAIDGGDGWAVVFKMESHNHPSFIEPYQGAATGVGGILRDVFTMGARPIALLNALRFGRPEHPKTPHLVSGVVAGIGGYGNCIGVPTVGGDVMFDASYDGNILVNAFALGVAPKDRIFLGVAEGVGNPVFYVGSKTGRDGIHGATMASEEFSEGSEEKRPTVQVGDPFTEKLLLEACLDVMAEDILVGVQDMGAAGLTSSSCEMASRAGSGLVLHLDRVPMREQGMVPYELLLSESQERMLMVCARGKEARLIELVSRWGLDVCQVGEVTETGRFVCTWDGETVVDVPVAALVDEAPVYDRPQSPAPPAACVEALPEPSSVGKALLDLLGRPTIASKRWVYEQYDHMVRTGTVVRPGAGDAAVVRLPQTRRGIALSVDCNGRYCKLDPFVGGALAVVESALNVACVGARPQAITDCLNFASPERPEVMWQFAQAIDGIAAACRALDAPVVSGNVSLYNETNGVGIHPTPMIGMVGLLEDASTAVGSAWPAGRSLVLLGGAMPAFGGSEYLLMQGHALAGPLPDLDLPAARALIDLLLAAHGAGLVEAAHDASEGGLAVAVAEGCIQGDVGARVDLGATALALFGEAIGRVVVATGDAEALLARAQAAGVPARRLGFTGGDRLTLAGTDAALPVQALRAAWEGAFPAVVEG
ncbi:MAG: phosphoribosylformylglycinamidine synthase subunit PurL [Myxococcales bacterium]|nr:phosphoribosylformylglycinamidine synthase subunit PurL [Myxococcales bacterium]